MGGRKKGERDNQQRKKDRKKFFKKNIYGDNKG
jgi:hypothetical protein